MGYSRFFKEALSDRMAGDYMAIKSHLPFIKSHFRGHAIEFDTPDPLRGKLVDPQMNAWEFLPGEGVAKEDSKPEEGVLILPLRGLMTKFGDWWDYGTEDIADMMKQGFADPSVKAIVLQVHSGGGTTHSVIPLEAAIRRRNKPVIAAVDSKVMSSALYVTALCDRIFAVNEMAEVGSIGVMVQILDDRKMLKEWGITIREIYPPESNWKNLAVREALEGNDKLIIEEELSPWAQHFQNLVRENRAKLDEKVEGILNGRTFYAKDAVINGLVDDIMPMDDIVGYAFDFVSKNISQILNS